MSSAVPLRVAAVLLLVRTGCPRGGCGPADLVPAGAGDDRLVGGPGDDSLSGEAGRDRLAGRSGSDHDDAGRGRDGCRSPRVGPRCEP